MTVTEQQDHATQFLHAAGLRSTAPRRTVLAVLSRGGHYEASEVFEEVRKKLPGTSLQAIYGVLGAFTEAGLVRKLEPEGGSALYEISRGDNHHHIQCTECGWIEDVPCILGQAPCLIPVNDGGFQVHRAEVTFKGLCPKCQLARNQS